MNYIIVYNESLRSKIIYYNFLKNNSKKIRLVVKLPILTFKKNVDSLKFLSRILFNSTFTYIVYSFLQTFIYSIICKIFNSDIESLCKREKINFVKSKQFPDKLFLKNNVPNYDGKEIIFSSTMYILKKKDLYLKNIILNLHEANPHKFKGSSIYYHLAAQGIKNFNKNIGNYWK